MLTGLRHRCPPGSEAGFTLPELSVAMAAGIVVLIGLCSIIVVAMHQTQRTFTRVDATRQARTALGNIENELHSACVTGDPPIQAGSTDTKLVFLSDFGSVANPTPVWHELTFDSATATLSDASYTATYTPTSTGHVWTRGTTPTSTTTVLTNVGAQSSGTPIFQYYRYESEWSDSSGSYWIVPDGTDLAPGETGTPPNTPLSTSGSGLSADDAANTVEVVLRLLVGPSSENLNAPNLTSAEDPVTDAISLRLTTPPDYVPTGASAEGYGPCQ